MSSEYHSPQSPGVKPLSESNSANSSSSSICSSSSNGNGVGIETPLDMSVSAKPPPPPYREPLPGSTFANTLARPSVITQAPKREIPIANQENKDTAATIGKPSNN